MSYCRWSSDDHQCDAYVWADVDGTWRTEVASRRIAFNDDVVLPEPVSLDVGTANSDERNAWADAWFAREQQVRAIIDDESKWSWLELPTPEGGTSYAHHTPGECADNLERLRGLGFHVPQYAIDSLRGEEGP